jgi:hypothetical protein
VKSLVKAQVKTVSGKSCGKRIFLGGHFVENFVFVVILRKSEELLERRKNLHDYFRITIFFCTNHHFGLSKARQEMQPTLVRDFYIIALLMLSSIENNGEFICRYKRKVISWE